MYLIHYTDAVINNCQPDNRYGFIITLNLYYLFISLLFIIDQFSISLQNHYFAYVGLQMYFTYKRIAYKRIHPGVNVANVAWHTATPNYICLCDQMKKKLYDPIIHPLGQRWVKIQLSNFILSLSLPNGFVIMCSFSSSYKDINLYKLLLQEMEKIIYNIIK